MLLLFLIFLLSLPILITPCLVITRLCNCPTIDFITQTQIKKYPLSAYLGNRNTYNPTWSIEEGCKITVDCSSSPSNSFYFMIFRSDNPPIFNRRFLPTTNKNTTFSPTGISCAKVENEWQWQFYGGKVTDMAFAMQPEECGCVNLLVTYAFGAPAVATKLFGTCDIHQISCTNKAFLPNLCPGLPPAGGQFQAVLQSRANPTVINDMTCVSKKWYFNNRHMTDAFGFCVQPGALSWVKLTSPYKYPCNCREFDSLLFNDPTNLPRQLMPFDSTGAYAKYKYNSGSLTYNTATCTATPRCAGSDTLVMFSTTGAPKNYPPGSSPPFITCKPTPLATGGTSQYFWFSDGNMLSEPGYGCIAGCACKYVKLTALNVKKLVGSYSFYNFMSSYPIRTPNDNAPAQGCPTTVTCAAGFTLVVFDTQTVSTYSTGTLSSICTVSTRKWTINKATDIPVLSQLYAICVDFRGSQ